MGCCNSPLGGNQSTLMVCGKFEEPVNPDKGKCFPYRVKNDCEAPSVPQNPCNDTDAYIIVDTENPTKFIVIATLFDENCEPILDDDGNKIMTQIS